jgi:iron(III) transport system ATP-binding protein
MIGAGPATDSVRAVTTEAAVRVDGVVKHFGDTPVLREVSFAIGAGETVALLGPSGCGKTTLLRSIAGLERIDAGTIVLDGTVVSASRVHVAPERRRIGMVFQDWALFPHLTVGQNVEYGLSRGERRGERVDETLDLVGLSGLRDRMPSTLSGGQQQRVALARALAPQPQAILLDEPFSNLDTALRVQVRTEVHRLLTDLAITTVFVTHDQEEAFVLGDRVAVMNGGRIEQHGEPHVLYDRPASRWIAEFVGEANLLAADASGETATTPFGPVRLTEPRHGSVEVLLRPEQIDLCEANDGDGHGVVELVEYYGHDHVSLVTLDDGTALRSRRPGAPALRRGQRVTVRTLAGTVAAFEPTPEP